MSFKIKCVYPILENFDLNLLGENLLASLNSSKKQTKLPELLTL